MRTKCPIRVCEIPFTVDRGNPDSLARQVAEGCRDAIASGSFKIGRMLPSLHDLAENLGVGVKVVRSAYERLAKEGWLLPKKGVGYFVKDSALPAWRGTALIVCDTNNYAMRTHADALAYGLEREGYMADCISLSNMKEYGTHDLGRLRMYIFRGYDLVFTYVMAPDVLEALRGMECPIFACAPDASRYPFLKHIDNESATAFGELMDVCRKKNVKTVEMVGLGYYSRVEKMLRDRGFHVVHTITTSVRSENLRFSSIRQNAMNMFVRRLASSNRSLPDLFLFMDDFVLAGALMAFLKMGVRIPEDVRVVGVCNVGDEPCWENQIAEIAIDQRRSGLRMAKEILCCMSGGDVKPVEGVEQFIAGKTL